MDHYFPHGRLAYVQIPAKDTRASADFYRLNFDWRIREGDKDYHLSFSDATGDMIGSFDTRISPVETPMLYIYVHGLDELLGRVDVVRDKYLEGDIYIATIHDPAGNVIGVWEKAGL